MPDMLTLKRADIIETREKTVWIEADCIVDGSNEISMRFWAAKSQVQLKGSYLAMPLWLVEQCETNIAEWQAQQGRPVKSVGILVLEGD